MSDVPTWVPGGMKNESVICESPGLITDLTEAVPMLLWLVSKRFIVKRAGMVSPEDIDTWTKLFCPFFIIEAGFPSWSTSFTESIDMLCVLITLKVVEFV